MTPWVWIVLGAVGLLAVRAIWSQRRQQRHRRLLNSLGSAREHIRVTRFGD